MHLVGHRAKSLLHGIEAPNTGQQNKIIFSLKEDGRLPRSCNYKMSHAVLLLLSSNSSPHFCFLSEPVSLILVLKLSVHSTIVTVIP